MFLQMNKAKKILLNKKFMQIKMIINMIKRKDLLKLIKNTNIYLGSIKL